MNMLATETEGLLLDAHLIVLGEKIGKGCQSEVYCGTHSVTKQSFAVKVIPSPVAGSRDKERAEFEIHSNYLLSNQLKSEYFPYFHGYWYDHESVKLVFERCVCNAYSAVKTIKNYNERYNFVVVLLHDMLQALRLLEGRDIVHRDIKPENILVVGGTFKLGDLGLSRIYQSNTLLTSDVGNELSRSPQFYSGVYDCRTDVWSLAVNAFYMLEDTLPFDEYTRSLCTRRNEFVERIRSKLFQIDLLPAGAKSKTKSWVHEIFVDMLIIEPTKRLTAEQLIEKHFVWKINRGIQDRQFLQISKQLLVGYLASSRRIEGGKVVCYYLALLLALHDYHRMDDKLKGVSNSDGKKRICLKVKLEINRFVVLLQHWQSKVMPAEQSKEEEENYCLSEAMTKMTESWKQELIQQFGREQTHLDDPRELLAVYAIKKVKEKFPLLEWCSRIAVWLIKEQEISPAAGLALWEIPVDLRRRQ